MLVSFSLVFQYFPAKSALKSPKPALKKLAKPALKRPNRHLKKKKYIKKMKAGTRAPKPHLTEGLEELVPLNNTNPWNLVFAVGDVCVCGEKCHEICRE